MNMFVSPASSATPNGTTRPQVRIVIVGHVDHGKSTLVGRLLHETGSLPDGKLEMLKAVSARRGMPFEWSFLLDALQTERDQGITIDTTQIRFRTGSRDIVLIDAPGHAEFLRNMITGASQADGAVLIIDALEGVRDQTRRHGYLLHLLGIKQVAVVVNKMDRVDFSAARFGEIRDEISAHLIGLGVTPLAVIPISARDGDGVADPQNLYDATLAAARYLCSGGLNLRDPTQVMTAILRYNNSMSYAQNVLGWAAAYATGVAPVDLPPITGPPPPLGDAHDEHPEGLGPGLPMNIMGLPVDDPLTHTPLIDFGPSVANQPPTPSGLQPAPRAPTCTLICIGSQDPAPPPQRPTP